MPWFSLPLRACALARDVFAPSPAAMQPAFATSCKTIRRADLPKRGVMLGAISK